MPMSSRKSFRRSIISAIRVFGCNLSSITDHSCLVKTTPNPLGCSQLAIGRKVSIRRFWWVSMLLVIGLVFYVLLTMKSSFPMEKEYNVAMNNMSEWKEVSKVNHIQRSIIELGTVELTVRMTNQPELVNLFFCDFLRSASVFWSPLYGPIAIIVDSTDLNNTFFPGKLAAVPSNFQFRIIPELPPSNLLRFRQVWKHMNYRDFGYSIQLYSSFLMDRYTNASIIAWSDTDVVFTTVITPGRIKRNGKILVKGANTYHVGNIAGWSKMTRAFLGLANIADFMTFFPTFVYPSTIRNCREYVMKRFNRTDFEEAFMDAVLSGPPGLLVSSVNVIYTYAFYFEKHLYEFHIDPWHDTLDEYNKKYLMPGHYLSSEDVLPDLHVGIHSKYAANKTSDFEIAICHAQKNASGTNRSFCREIISSPNFLLMRFEKNVNHLNTWCMGVLMKSCMSILEAHEAEVAAYVREFSFKPEAILQVEALAKLHYDTVCAPVTTS